MLQIEYKLSRKCICSNIRRVVLESRCIWWDCLWIVGIWFAKLSCFYLQLHFFVPPQCKAARGENGTHHHCLMFIPLECKTSQQISWDISAIRTSPLDSPAQISWHVACKVLHLFKSQARRKKWTKQMGTGHVKSFLPTEKEKSSFVSLNFQDVNLKTASSRHKTQKTIRTLQALLGEEHIIAPTLQRSWQQVISLFLWAFTSSSLPLLTQALLPFLVSSFSELKPCEKTRPPDRGWTPWHILRNQPLIPNQDVHGLCLCRAPVLCGVCLILCFVFVFSQQWNPQMCWGENSCKNYFTFCDQVDSAKCTHRQKHWLDHFLFLI